MDCTCSEQLSCLPHRVIRRRPKRALTAAHHTVLARYEDRDLERLTSAETRLLCDAWDIMDEASR